MDRSRFEQDAKPTTELNIEKALEFAGDNSSYQKKRLVIVTIMVLSLAILTCKIPFMGPKITLMFLISCGFGQIICPIYLSFDETTLGIAAFASLAFITYPFSEFFTEVCYIGIGFFSRGFFVSSLIYLNEIGGDRFKAWSIVVIFATWGISSLIASLEMMIGLPRFIWYYLLIFLPMICNSFLVFKFWKPSPYSLHAQKQFGRAKEVLNDIAQQNLRPPLPYSLEGEADHNEFSQINKPGYFEIVYQPLLRNITTPLVIIWIYKEYIYYASFTLLPQLGDEHSKNYILISISQTVAVLMSYPIRLKIRRVNAIFGLILIITICSFMSSFSVVSEECMEKGFVCSTKYIYRISIMLIRFSIALVGNILISYTLEAYPSNFRNLAYGLCLTASSVGSILFPWVNEAFIFAGMSGFIGLAAASFITLYFITQLLQTYGRMRKERLEDLQKKSPLITLQNWKHLNF